MIALRLAMQHSAPERSPEASYVTVMFPKFFGVPQAVIRSGTWGRMKPRQQSLYICLLYESERYRTRKLRRTDAEMSKLGSICARSLRDARTKLQEYGLVVCERGCGNVYTYTLCDPETGTPWAGDPKKPVPYVRKTERRPVSCPASIEKTPEAESVNSGLKSDVRPRGLPLPF